MQKMQKGNWVGKTWHKHAQNKYASTQVEHQNALASLQVDSVEKLEGFFDARIVWTKLHDASRFFKSDFPSSDLIFVDILISHEFLTPF